MNDLQSLNSQAVTYQCPDNAFKDRIILVTGAGDGIGRAVSLGLARHGATVIPLGRTQSKLEAVYDEIKAAGGPEPALAPVNMTVARPSDYLELASLFEKEFGRLDGVLHNASLLGDITPMDGYSADTWDSVMQVNVNAAFYLTQALLPLLRNSDDARILFTSSSVGRRGRAYWGAYSVSKAATENLAQVLAEELENTSKIRVNTVNPGATRTAMRANAYPGEDPMTLKTPEELLPVYLYLLGPDSSNVNGVSLDAQPK
ncbi:YciK family oxidoreductase [Alloalcanivorax xenomutans]